MSTRRVTTRRVLALDPTTRGFGYAVLEGQDRLIEWGFREIRSEKHERTLKAVARLLKCYDPDSFVLEDCLSGRTRRNWRIRDLVAAIVHLSRDESRQVRLLNRDQLLASFGLPKQASKHTLAEVIAGRFPELEPSLPPKRKPWMSEDPRFSTFRAVALACVHKIRNKSAG